MNILCFVFYLAATTTILYWRINYYSWEIVSAIYLIIATFIIGLSWWVAIILWVVILSVAAIINLTPLRLMIADFLFQRVHKTIPKLSKTEIEALNCGDTWFEQDIFRGTPDWQSLANVNDALTAEEESFLQNETNDLCKMLDDWQISKDGDLSSETWQFIKDKGFFGLVISKKYGGKGFSARAHSDIITKIATRSGAAAVTIMVPNSLGPGELLTHYGTEEQKAQYLPKLAVGLEIPCFALTEPGAGSDATSIKSDAIVKEKEIDGKKILGLELTLNKRWITLAPIATLIGLAVNLRDPDGLLKGDGEEGITCLLIPRNTKNLIIGNRHLPANSAFMNGTIRGKNIFVPINTIIGGQKKAGQGWAMLVECLSIGRSISLPALGSAFAAVSYISSSAFSRLRKQFNTEVGKFEGVEEKLAEIGGLSYIIHATRLLTVAAVNEQKKPSVASAITKYFNTELGRIAINNAMDIHAGRAVVEGPRNYLTNLYFSLPISITVEGANIMSRNLLIFGQGSMACHPFVRKEFEAISQNDRPEFRKLVWQHISYFMHNFAKTIGAGWTGGWLIFSPSSSWKKDNLNREYQKLSRLSYAFAWLADVALTYLGGGLKRKERLSARLADALSYLYLAMAVLRFTQFTKENVHAKWACAYCFYHAQQAMIAFCNNFPSRFLGILLRLVIFPVGQTMKYPKDSLSKRLAIIMTQNNSYRESVKKLTYLSHNSKDPIDRMENALQLLMQHNDLVTKTKNFNYFDVDTIYKLFLDKINSKELTNDEVNSLLLLEEARWDAMQVDEFTLESIKEKSFKSVADNFANPFTEVKKLLNL